MTPPFVIRVKILRAAFDDPETRKKLIDPEKIGFKVLELKP